MSEPLVNFTRQHFEQLFRKEIGRLHGYACQYVEDRDAAMDICQHVFVRLWEKRSEINPQDNVRSYLYTSVRNRCLNYLRDQKKYRSTVLDLECAEADVIPAATDAGMDSEALEQQITAAIAALPDKCREVFEMSRFREMKYREIAEALDISQKTVEAHMSKAMKLLKESLAHLKSVILLIAYFFGSGS